MVVVAAVVALGCLLLGLLIWRERQGRERASELDDALAQLRDRLHWRRPLIAIAVLVALALVAIVARNPSRWPALLFGLAAIGVALAVAVLRRRRR